MLKEAGYIEWNKQFGRAKQYGATLSRSIFSEVKNILASVIACKIHYKEKGQNMLKGKDNNQNKKNLYFIIIFIILVVYNFFKNEYVNCNFSIYSRFNLSFNV